MDAGPSTNLGDDETLPTVDMFGGNVEYEEEPTETGDEAHTVPQDHDMVNPESIFYETNIPIASTEYAFLAAIERMEDRMIRSHESCLAKYGELPTRIGQKLNEIADRDAKLCEEMVESRKTLETFITVVLEDMKKCISPRKEPDASPGNVIILPSAAATSGSGLEPSGEDKNA